MMTRDDLLTVDQISEILQISVNTIQRKRWRERTGCPIRNKAGRLFAFIDELQRCEQLGLDKLNFHPGSHLAKVSKKDKE